MADLQAIKANSRAKEALEKRIAERRRASLVLILRHLVDCGYTDTYERLSTEANISLNKVDVADNISLLQIIQEFEDAYEERLGQRPKLIRHANPSSNPGYEDYGAAGARGGGRGVQAGRLPPAGVLSAPPPANPAAPSKGLDGPPVSGAMAARQRRDKAQADNNSKKAEAAERRQKAMDGVRAPSDLGVQRVGGVVVGAHGVSGSEDHSAAGSPQLGLAVAGAAVGRAPDHEASGEGGGSDDDREMAFARRLLKPLPGHLRGDLAELSAVITRDIYVDNPNVRWEDIAGLDAAKQLLVEAVVQPIKYPQLFTGLLAPWKGVLLYGPPGTGKTLLAKAVATECSTTFFNVQASTIISKWRGDSEKLVRVLFELARHHAPSTIFLDEIDALMMARGGEGEHEASRRMKTELLIQMDGLARTNAMVFVLTATNLPWELDMAMLRRLEKRILVPLPNAQARAKMFSSLLAGRCAPEISWDMLADRTEGYSGSDVSLVAKEAAMRPLRRLMSQLEVVSTLPGPASRLGPTAPQPDRPLQLEPVTLSDVDASLEVTKPSARLHESRYLKFSEEYGQLGS